MQIILSGLSLATILLLSGCGSNDATHEQTIKATTDKNNIKVGENINFSATGVGTYAWYSESGKLLSNEKNFNRSFFKEGNYKTILKVTDSNGVITSSEINVKVDRHTTQTQIQTDPNNQAPTAVASISSYEICTGEGVRFFGDDSSDSDGSIVSYSWRDMDGIEISTQSSFSRGFPYDATYHKTLTVTDDKGATHSQTVDLVVKDCNQAPTATAQTITMNEDTTRAITLSGTDPDGDNLTYTVTTNPSHGTFNGTTYTPNPNYHGSDSFSFTANDGSLTSTPATVTITVTSINDAPTVEAGSNTTITQGDSYSPNPTSSDIDGTIASTVWKEGATTLTFPKTDFSVGDHILTVTVTDNEGLTATDTLTLTVNAAATSCTPLHKTGQTTTYHNNDDGDSEKGATRSYTRDDANNIVTDNVTNLMWQDNESITKKWVTQANYDAGNYSDTSGDTATTYCTNLALGGHNDWRLPTIEELVYITDKGRVNPAIDPVFQNQVSDDYWSSTTVASNTSNAWVVSFSNGYDNYSNKTYDCYVRCVRDGQ